ncbi:MAG TPA: HAD hydrolase-like protein [Dehalococcoidales bacterium]|nr:HAD hydrolase-like protein [Dehalococcoidales bacterium]
MINPSDVGLIIFDMDGTILPSLAPFFESIKRAFGKLGWPITFTPAQVQRFFGVSTASVKGSVYEFITPPNSPLSAEEVREKVRAENIDTFREMAAAYPGVKETLTALRRRGYKLAQYSNAAPAYFNTILGSLGIRDYYDYAECIGDNNLDKVTLVRKIKAHFGGAAAAIVGDRCHDIEAAQETGSLSIGARYGYGGKEPEEADLKIDKFDDLLGIFDRSEQVFNKIAASIKPTGRPYVIGVSGIDCAGKTTFADALARHLKLRGFKTQPVHLDDFHNPKAVRYSGTDEAVNYFKNSFNIRQLTEKLLVPMREKNNYTATLKLLDLATDKYSRTIRYTFLPDTIVVLEGVFLFRKELAPFIDYKIWLEIPFEESQRRAISRDSRETNLKYVTKYLPAQRKYIQETNPRSTADIVVDNTNYEYPVILK